MYILTISEHCDLDEINLKQGAIADKAELKVAGKYLKQEHTINGKPWYIHDDQSKASQYFYCLTTRL